jgi:hypothetical protein
VLLLRTTAGLIRPYAGGINYGLPGLSPLKQAQARQSRLQDVLKQMPYGKELRDSGWNLGGQSPQRKTPTRQFWVWIWQRTVWKTLGFGQLLVATYAN